VAYLEDKIQQVQDKELRDILLAEVKKLKKEKKFGLVFEEHVPELVPVYSAPIRPRATVALKDGDLLETFRVKRIKDGQATVSQDSNGSERVFPVNQLVVVQRFGEAIYPALELKDRVQNGGDRPFHTLIEADNYHALQLLDYLYAGQVDCIYIDPPYNTGAKDWKYNNYVDSNDSWRHSKWLTFMEKRLKLAKKLLKPDTGVLIVTIDEHEVHHLGMLLEREFPDKYRQMVTIVINPKGVTQGRFSRVEEYALFCFGKQAFVKGIGDDLLSSASTISKSTPRWKGLLRSGTNARRQDRHKMFFPVLIDKESHAVVGTGDFLPLDVNNHAKLTQVWGKNVIEK
jgi:adenine-specific DNA-methyltransferase